MKQCIIKRHGREEHYDERKVYASAYAACLNAHLKKEEAERIASGVSMVITAWVDDRGATSDELFKKVTEELRRHNPDAAFMYETHRDLS